jgi:hypothetical protein
MKFETAVMDVDLVLRRKARMAILQEKKEVRGQKL